MLSFVDFVVIQVSTQLQCRNDNQTWDSVRRDDEHIVGLLKGLLYTKDGQQAVLSLRETEAESFLNLLDKVGQCPMR